MSMTPTEDESVVRKLLGDPKRWLETAAARDAAQVRASIDQSRALRAQNILTYLTADRSGWPAEVDAMMREELGIDDLPPLTPPPAQLAPATYEQAPVR